MMVVFPAPLVPSRAVIWPLWKVRLRFWMAILWPSYSLLTDTKATPTGPPSSSSSPLWDDNPVKKMLIHQENQEARLHWHNRGPSRASLSSANRHSHSSSGLPGQQQPRMSTEWWGRWRGDVISLSLPSLPSHSPLPNPA